jgi:hypothetical protein
MIKLLKIKIERNWYRSRPRVNYEMDDGIVSYNYMSQISLLYNVPRIV